ncbi:MAG: 50S ribosomal protein L10 [Pseudomonadota bacterium]
MLGLEDKKAIVAEVNAIAALAHSAVAAEYRGMTVDQLTKMRVDARNSGVYLRVVRNTLARRAVAGTSFECMQEGLKGPLILAFSQQDPGSAARVISKFAKDNDKLKVKLVALGGKLLNASDLEAVAKLPTRNEALSLLLAVMKAPVQKLARTLNAVPTTLVRTVVAIKEQKEQSA